MFSICEVAIKGDDKHEEYVEEYRLLLSLDGITWSSYKEHGSEKVHRKTNEINRDRWGTLVRKLELEDEGL